MTKTPTLQEADHASCMINLQSQAVSYAELVNHYSLIIEGNLLTTKIDQSLTGGKTGQTILANRSDRSNQN